MAVIEAWYDGEGRTWLATSGADGSIHLWDADAALESGPPLHGHTSGVWALTMWRGAAGIRLASAGEDSTIRIWDPRAAAAVGEPLVGHRGWVQALASWTLPDGSVRLASAGADGWIRIWDPESGREVRRLSAGGDVPIWALTAWSQAGAVRLASGDGEGVIRVWDPESGRAVAGPMIGPRAVPWALVAWVEASGAVRLASGGTDGVVRRWDPVTGEPAGPALTGHTGWVPALKLYRARDGSLRMASVSTDGTIRVWDLDSGRPIGAPITVRPGMVMMLAAWTSGDGAPRLACGGEGGTIQTWDPETGAEVGRSASGHTAGLWALASWADARGVRVAAAGDNGTVKVWNSVSGAQASPELTGHTASIWALAYWNTAAGSRLASSGDDGTIRIWDPETGEAAFAPLLGHVGWVPALTTWKTREGGNRLASAGVDTTVRIWNADDGSPIGPALTGHTAWVMALASWTTPDGARRVASADFDGTIRVWDPESAVEVCPPLTGHDGCVRSLVAWTDPDGSARLASGGFDATIRIWDPQTGSAIGAPLTGHRGRVPALVAWTDGQGVARLASAGGDDATIRVWSLGEHPESGLILHGHDAGVWALTVWTDPESGPRLASTGYDGSIRLWDAETGAVLRTIEVGPVAIWGLSDAPADHDALSRQSLADAIAEQVGRFGTGGGDPGPAVVGVEGPWGSGKSTLMELVRSRLRTLHPPPPAGPTDDRKFTVRDALRLLGGRPAPEAEAGRPQAASRGVLTAWFNPWAHQSGEQVWAGFAHVIIEAAASALYPSSASRERYWFSRNIDRIDRYAVRALLRRRMISPLFGLALIATAAQAVIALAALDRPIRLLGHAFTTGAVAFCATLAILVAGLAHTAARWRWGGAANFLPAEILLRPISEPVPVASSGDLAAIDDPLHRARAGSLYLHQHDIGDVLADLSDGGHTLIVFIDDLDRCRAAATTEVFEAVNLFLSSIISTRETRTRFVIGFDPAVVAGHLDAADPLPREARPTAQGEDPSAGWAFLRKLIQLPVILPQVSDQAVSRFVDAVTGAAAPSSAQSTQPTPSMPRHPGAQENAGPDGLGTRATAPRPAPAVRSEPLLPAAASEVLPWRTMERHPLIHGMFVERLRAQPDRSLREAKRLLNVWQLYERVLGVTAPPADPAQWITRSRNLVLVAEIITRWPALQRDLHRRIGDRRGMQILAEATADDDRWDEAIGFLGIDAARHQPALANLRGLLRDYDGRAIADLASQVL